MINQLFEWKSKEDGSVTAYPQDKRVVYASLHTAILETRKK